MQYLSRLGLVHAGNQHNTIRCHDLQNLVSPSIVMRRSCQCMMLMDLYILDIFPELPMRLLGMM